MMAKVCCEPVSAAAPAPGHRYRNVLWVALLVNALLFVIEVTSGLQSGSVSLLADAIDFLGDAANYALSLAVLSLSLMWRARAAAVKGFSMAAFGLFVLGKAGWAMTTGVPPEALVMGAVAMLALVANVGVAILLYAYREGDANMRSVWLCSRNDAIGNVGVMLAALGVFGTGSAWPDIVVAVIMAVLALSAAVHVLRRAREELGTTSVG